MKTMTVGEFKTHFSEAIKLVEMGQKIAITFGKKKEIKAYFVPKQQEMKPRKLGILEGRGKVEFKSNFKITEEEFLGL